MPPRLPDFTPSADALTAPGGQLYMETVAEAQARRARGEYRRSDYCCDYMQLNEVLHWNPEVRTIAELEPVALRELGLDGAQVRQCLSALRATGRLSTSRGRRGFRHRCGWRCERLYDKGITTLTPPELRNARATRA
jgi:hypothetical protein